MVRLDGHGHRLTVESPGNSANTASGSVGLRHGRRRREADVSVGQFNGIERVHENQVSPRIEPIGPQVLSRDFEYFPVGRGGTGTVESPGNSTESPGNSTSTTFGAMAGAASL
jgi:hypothetical protein